MGVAWRRLLVASRDDPRFQAFFQNAKHRWPPYKSFPAYERLKLLLISGKSGMMFPKTANWMAGQFTNDGSRTLHRWIAPSCPAMTKYKISPRHPSTAESAHSPAAGMPVGI